MILPPPLRVIPILTTGPGPPRFARDLQGGMTAVDGPTVLSPIYAAARGGPFPGPSASVAPPSIHHVAEPLPGPHTLQVFHKLSERFLQERGSRQVGRHDHPGVRPQGAVGGEGFLLEDVEDRPPGPPSSKAGRRVSSWTTAPRPTLTKMAPGRMDAHSALPNIPRVFSVRGVEATTTSPCGRASRSWSWG